MSRIRLSELKKLVEQLSSGGGGGGELDFEAVVTPTFASAGTDLSGIGFGGPQLVDPSDPTVPNMIYALVEVADGSSATLDVSIPSWDGSTMTLERTPVVGVSMLSGRIPPGAQYKVNPGSGGSLLDLSEVPIH